jgi:Fe-S-cluster-containing dehydrogenase component
MTQLAIVTDIDRCVGCLACTVACKVMHDVPIGNYWTRPLRVGPTPKRDGDNWPDVDLYFLNLSCQHCENPQCVSVCPTGASTKRDDGTVQIDEDACIGCGACVSACPYGIRYLNEETQVAQKCNLCQDIIDEVGLPRCVSQCCGMARWYGDVDEGIEGFKGPRDETLGDFLEPFTDDQVHRIKDAGNGPSCLYILRDMAWQDEEFAMPS